MLSRSGTAAAIGCALILLASGCNQPATAPDTRAADEAAIKQADIAWAKASAAKHLDGVVAPYAEDADSYGPNMPAVTGKEAIRKSMAEAFALPGFSLTWTVAKVEVARSGDMGYSSGPYQMTMKGPKGEEMKDHGHYVTVWKKQPDGKWLVVQDIATSEVPMTPPAK